MVIRRKDPAIPARNLDHCVERHVPLGNRVDPWGRIFATHERGYLMGNRDYGDAWIMCSLRHCDGTTVPSTVSYFKLFFLDEDTGLPPRIDHAHSTGRSLRTVRDVSRRDVRRADRRDSAGRVRRLIFAASDYVRSRAGNKRLTIRTTRQ